MKLSIPKWNIPIINGTFLVDTPLALALYGMHLEEALIHNLYPTHYKEPTSSNDLQPFIIDGGLPVTLDLMLE